ncbi:MAG: hypothetical protein EA392_14105 [Cryomorphaceae bacterium]|nr:MAG: hypothetical protein EA392_14105 [Cryomorphaceae bacterium]
MNTVSKSIRAVNYLIDSLFIAIATAICNEVVPDTSKYILFASISVFYYTCFETFTGQTPGKRITNTVVACRDGSKPGAFRILIRSVLRLNPLDVFSYLFGNEMGTHDVLSGTRLQVKE